MKNNFFADKHDFFKWDLLLTIMEDIPELVQLTYIPMLTPDDRGGDARHTAVGDRHTELFEFFHECLKQERRNIKELRTFFKGHRYKYTPYRDCGYFEHEDRKRYFEEIPNSALTQALVFLDPDTGLEPRTRPADANKYVCYADLPGIFRRMADSSVLVLYQHRAQGKKWEEIVPGKCRRIGEELAREDCMCVSDGEVAFFAVAKSPRTSKLMRAVLKEYAESTDRKFWHEKILRTVADALEPP